MPGFKYRRTLKVGWAIKSFLKLGAGIIRSEPNLNRWIERQARRTNWQAQGIKAQVRQLQRLNKLLGKKDLQRAIWETGKASELDYWRSWLRTKGCLSPEDCSPEEYKKRFVDPESALEDRIRKHLNAPHGATVSILDVGAGAATKLGKRWEGRTIKITAVDPLADDYGRLLEEFGLTPLVQTQPGEVERLTERFPRNCFDLVYMENALDHSYDPLIGIRQMLEVVKPGGYVLLEHYVNEGEWGGYGDWHRWNFCIDYGHFIIWNPKTRFSVNDAVGDIAQVTTETRRVNLNPQNAERDERFIKDKLFVSLRKR